MAAPSALQRLAKLVQEAEEDVPPRTPPKRGEWACIRCAGVGETTKIVLSCIVQLLGAAPSRDTPRHDLVENPP